jgi:hypothetical protein
MKQNKSNNILRKAMNIIYNRNSEKAKEYGPFEESMASAARIASEMTGKNITTEDFYKCMVALKMSRLRYSRLRYSSKEDTFLDGAAYLGSLHKHITEENEI